MRKIHWIITAFLLNFSLAAWSNQTTQNIQVKENAPTFTIQLPANPSTGYQWFLMHYNPRLVKPLSHNYTPASTGLVGSAGSSQWQFSAQPTAFTVPQSSKLRFEYRRPWEKSAGQKEEITVFFIPNK